MAHEFAYAATRESTPVARAAESSNLRHHGTLIGEREDDLNKMEDKPINQIQPNWL